MLQCRCPPEHLRSTASCYFHGVRHPSCGLPNQCRSFHIGAPQPERTFGCPPPSLHQACPGFHGSSTSLSFSRARGVRAEGIFHRRSVSCTTHTQKSDVAFPHVPAPSIAQNHSTSSAVVKMLRNVVIQRVRVAFPQSGTHGLSCDQLPCWNRTLYEGPSQCRAVSQIVSPAQWTVQDRRSQPRAFRFVPEQPSTCWALQLVFQAEPQCSCHLPCSTTAGMSIGIATDWFDTRCSVSTWVGSTFSMRRRTPAISKFQMHQVLVSCLSSTRFQPTEHGLSHHQPLPLRCGSCMPPYAAWGLFKHPASHPVASCCEAVSFQFDILSQISSPHRSSNHVSTVGQFFTFGNRCIRNHSRYCTQIRFSWEQLPRHTLDLVKEFHICSFLQCLLRARTTQSAVPTSNSDLLSTTPRIHTFQESTCSLANGRGRGQTRQRQEQFSERSPFQSLMRCQPICSDLSARDLAGSIGDEPGQHRVLRTNVFLVQLAQRNFNRSRHTLYFSDCHLGIRSCHPWSP